MSELLMLEYAYKIKTTWTLGCILASSLGLLMPDLTVLSEKISGTKPAQKPVKSNSENNLT